MLSQAQIQLKAQQYLQRFEQSHIQKQTLLKQLQAKVNHAARIIQRMWKKYLLRKRMLSAIKIQNAWKVYRGKIKVLRGKVKRFKEVFFAGKISNFIFQKYFARKKTTTKGDGKPTQTIGKSLKIQSNILTHFPQFIALSQAYKSQTSYIQKLRAYQKGNFSQSWQAYEQKLKAQLSKQASKKWVKKNQTIWITQQNKEINLEDYIEKQVEKIFEREYNKYKEADKKLEATAVLLGKKVSEFTLRYYRAMLQGEGKM